MGWMKCSKMVPMARNVYYFGSIFLRAIIYLQSVAISNKKKQSPLSSINFTKKSDDCNGCNLSNKTNVTFVVQALVKHVIWKLIITKPIMKCDSFNKSFLQKPTLMAFIMEWDLTHGQVEEKVVLFAGATTNELLFALPSRVSQLCFMLAEASKLPRDISELVLVCIGDSWIILVSWSNLSFGNSI